MIVDCVRQKMFLLRHDKDGSENELFNEVVDALGEDAIDKETTDRVIRKKAEAEEETQAKPPRGSTLTFNPRKGSDLEVDPMK